MNEWAKKKAINIFKLKIDYIPTNTFVYFFVYFNVNGGFEPLTHPVWNHAWKRRLYVNVDFVIICFRFIFFIVFFFYKRFSSWTHTFSSRSVCVRNTGGEGVKLTQLKIRFCRAIQTLTAIVFFLLLTVNLSKFEN